MKLFIIPQLECKWHISLWFVIIFWPQSRWKYFVLNSITWWTVHIQYDNLCNVKYHYITSLFTTVWYERVLYCSMSFVSLLIGLITYWKKTLDLLCMLCNLCFVSVKKKVEKWVSWLLVSVEMAPSEIVVEDDSLVWHSKKTWFPSQDNLRSRATPTSTPLLPPPIPLSSCHHQYQHTNISMQASLHKQTHIIMRTCWPVLLRRREMLSNSAFQHSTSDYLFSFTGGFELVMCFPFSVGLASLFLSLSFSQTHWEFLSPQCMKSTWIEN